MAKARKRVSTSRLRSIPLKFIQCRAWGHGWDEYIPAGMRSPSFGYRESLLCVRCSTERHFLIDSLGNVASRQYVYPEGYKLGFSAKRAEFRRELRKLGFYEPAARRSHGARAS